MQSVSKVDDDDAEMDTEESEELSQNQSARSASQSISQKDEKKESSATELTQSTGRAKVTSHDCLFLISRCFWPHSLRFSVLHRKKLAATMIRLLCSFSLAFE
jgi:hypothetical protein